MADSSCNKTELVRFNEASRELRMDDGEVRLNKKLEQLVKGKQKGRDDE